LFIHDPKTDELIRQLQARLYRLAKEEVVSLHDRQGQGFAGIGWHLIDSSPQTDSWVLISVMRPEKVAPRNNHHDPDRA
jgi:hypothetical protein